MSTITTPKVGAVYKFTFDTAYAAFDGIYRVSGIQSYDEYVASGGDIGSDFFSPNNQESALEDELPTVRKSPILKLESPDTDSTDDPKYAPLCYVSETPDYNVKKYNKFGMITYIGLCEDPTVFDFIKDTVIETVEAAFGITPEPMFVTTGEQWMTEAEFNNVLKSRDESKKKILNYYSENLRLEKELSQAKTKLNEYEKIIISLQSQVNKLKA